MTARQAYNGLLIELSKVNSPSMLLQDFNYFINKAINLYVNKRYSQYDTSLQTTDDLRVLRKTVTLKVLNNLKKESNILTYFPTYSVTLPNDYLHLLNCVCNYNIKGVYKCLNSGQCLFSAKRLTADSWSTVLGDYYNRPKPERPYYYIYNYFPSEVDNEEDSEKGTNNEENNNESSLNTIPITSLIQTPAVPTFPNGIRKGNATSVMMEIRCGQDNSNLELDKVQIDYLCSPQIVELTREQLDLTTDTSQIIEFPDYGCQEIMNELVRLVMENVADPRLLTYTPVTQSIVDPAQQLK